MSKRKTITAPGKIDDRPEVKLHVQTNRHPNAVRIEILISGADESVRDLVADSIKMAVDGLTGVELR